MTKKKTPGRPRKKGGRPTKYRRTWPKRARDMAAEGILEQDIAKAFGITPTTLCNYKKKHPELAEAIDEGYQAIIPKVEAALLKTALGYESVEETTTIHPSGEITVTKKKRTIEPNQKAIEFYLTNKSTEWRRKKQVEHSGKVKGEVTLGAPVLNFRDMTPNKEPSLAEFLEQQEKEKGKENGIN